MRFFCIRSVIATSHALVMYVRNVRSSGRLSGLTSETADFDCRPVCNGVAPSSSLRSRQGTLKMMRQRDWLLLGGGIAAGIVLGACVPKLRRHLGPVIAEAGARAGGVFSTLAETVASQMERVEDYAAERRAASSSEG